MSAVEFERPSYGARGVGAELRSARERLGWDLASLSATLRIRLPYLQAIEDGRVSDLPGSAYAIGFLRTYASCLGLDADELSRRFRSEVHEVNQKTELEFPAPVPERGVPAGAVVLLGIVIAVGAYVGWYRSSGDQRTPVETVPAVPDRLAPLARKDEPASTTSPQVASILPSTAPPSPQFAPPQHALTPSQAAAMTMPPAQPVEPPPAATAALPTVVTPTQSAAPDGRLVLRAKADAWMQVRVNHGPVLLNRVLHAGESWPVPGDKTDLLLTTGNAAGTEVDVDGIAAPPMSGGSIVKRDIQLDPDRIKAGRYATLSPPAAPRPKPKPAPAPSQDAADPSASVVGTPE